MPNFVSRLGDRQLPHYGQFVLLALLLMAALECRHIANDFSRGQRAQTYREQEIRPATVMSFLPASIRHCERAIAICVYAFYVFAALWALQVGIPWTPWCAVLAFTGAMSIHFENMNWLTHATHVENILLVLYAIWYTAYGREIREALRAGTFWTTSLYPRWVFAASVAYVCIFYTNAGMNKLVFSGFSWVNGTSLQLWAYCFGDEHSPVRNLLIAHRWVAVTLQVFTLIAESCAFLAIPFPRLRPLFGLALLGFHVGSMRLFGYRFEANAVILILVLLPLNRWITQLAIRKCESNPPAPVPVRSTSPFMQAVLARIDIFGRRRAAEPVSV